MKNKIIPLNAAEGIFYPAFDRYLCNDEQVTVKGGEKNRLWDSLSFCGGKEMSIHWHGSVELEEYDGFLCFASISPGASVCGRAVVDGVERLLFENWKGGEAPVEMTGPLKTEPGGAGRLTDIFLDIKSCANQNVAVLSWLGVTKSFLEAEREKEVPVWDPEWERELNSGKTGVLDRNLVISEEEGLQLKKIVAEDQDLRRLLVENAELAMKIRAEDEVREYAPVALHLYRFVRVRDRGRIPLEGPVLNLAVAGYLLDQPDYSYQAARLILALLPMKWYEGPVCGMEGSRFHHVCFTEDHLLTEICLAVGFLGGIFTEDAHSRILNRVEEAWRFVHGKCMEPGYRNFMNQGIVGCRGDMVGAAFLTLRKGGYREFLEECYGRHCRLVDNYLAEDGHCAEGANYFEYSFTSSILLWHIYSRMTGKAVTEIVPEKFCKSGRYLAAIMSACDRSGRRIPLNCGGGFLSSAMLQMFMTMTCDFPEGNNYLITRFAGNEAEPGAASFDLLLYMLYKTKMEPQPYSRPQEEEISCLKSGLLTYRYGAAKLMVTAERNPLTGHFHEDRGGIVLEAGGDILLPELGTTSYSNPFCLIMDKKEYHNLACPEDLDMIVESDTGIHAAAAAAFPIEQILKIEDMETAEARVVEAGIADGGYHFAVETGMLYGSGISGVREGFMNPHKGMLDLDDRWTFPDSHPLLITYLSYCPWTTDRPGGTAVSGRLSITVETDGEWNFKTEEGMADFEGRPVYVLRIHVASAFHHEVKSRLFWTVKEMSPSYTGRENTMALQTLLDEGGTIRIEKPGIYEIKDSLIMKSHTHLCFGAGVFIRRSKTSVGSFAITNRGAFTREYDTDITIEGLHLITNGVEARDHAAVYGLTGELSFFYVRHLRITDFTCLDLPRLSFGIHVCTFEDMVIERIRVKGRKDAVHLGTGKKFVIRHGLFQTFDDPIALNAHDYAVANPQLGWIEDGVIEDCYDLADEDTTGYFCRILAGAWCDWYSGMEIQNSDSVVYGGRVYRAFQKPDGRMYRSVTPPTHERGMKVLDGIRWVMVQEGAVYQCGCRNIHFKDIHLQKERETALSIHFDHDQYSRSVYPGAVMPVQENLVFENLITENQVDCLVRSITPVDTVKIIASVLGEGKIRLESLPGEFPYPDTSVLLMGNTFRTAGSMELVECAPGRSCSLKAVGSITEQSDFKARTKGCVRVIEADIPIEEECNV